MTTDLEKNKPKAKMHLPLPPIWLTVTITAVIAFTIFMTYHRHLQKLAAPVQQAIQMFHQNQGGAQ